MHLFLKFSFCGLLRKVELYKQAYIISNAINAFFHQFSDGIIVRQLKSGGTAKVKGLNPGLVWGPKKLLWNPFSNNECETFGCSSTG